MGGWIKLWKDMADDPRLLDAAAHIASHYVGARSSPSGRGGTDLEPGARLNFFVSTSLGALVKLWMYADEHIRADDSLPITSSTLDAFIGLDGFYDAMPREWISETNDGRVVLPGYCEKNQIAAREERRIKQQGYTRKWRGNGEHKREHTVSSSRNANRVPLDQDRDHKSVVGLESPSRDVNTSSSLSSVARASGQSDLKIATERLVEQTRMPK